MESWVWITGANLERSLDTQGTLPTPDNQTWQVPVEMGLGIATREGVIGIWMFFKAVLISQMWKQL